jgi:hypothetical protein
LYLQGGGHDSFRITTGWYVGIWEYISPSSITESLTISWNIKLSQTGWIGTIPEQLSLWINGNIGIGTWAWSSNKLTIVGNLSVVWSGRFTSDVTAQAFFYSSDRRYKDNITLITDPLQKILGLNGYTFTWKDTGRADIWVIAQEVEQVFPQAVSTNTNGYKSVEYGNLIAPVIEAIKTLYYKYLDQEARIHVLEQEIATIKTSLH